MPRRKNTTRGPMTCAASKRRWNRRSEKRLARPTRTRSVKMRRPTVVAWTHNAAMKSQMPVLMLSRDAVRRKLARRPEIRSARTKSESVSRRRSA